MCERGVRSISGAMARWLRCRPRSYERHLTSRSDFLPNQIYVLLPRRQPYILFGRIMQIRRSFVSRWHDPGGIQGDGKHSHPESRHSSELRACRRSRRFKTGTLVEDIVVEMKMDPQIAGPDGFWRVKSSRL